MKNKYTYAQKRSNLAKLAKALMSRKFNINFDMSLFASSIDGQLLPNEVKNKCGTTCCALGHGPLIVNGKSEAPDWEDYCDETFIRFGSLNGLFLFSTYWPDDKLQFAARVYRYLKRRKITPEHRDETIDHEFEVPKASDFDQFILP
jgi:hypothetical protein